MKLPLKIIFSITILCLFLISCTSKKDKKTSNKINETFTDIKYAKGFEIQQFKDYKKLIIKTPYLNADEIFEYVLYDEKSTYKPTSTVTDIQIPLQRIVVTSTTHIPMLELLNEENSLVGFPNTKYVSSKKTRELIDANIVKEVGVKAALNTEILLELNPNAIIGFSMSKSNKSLNLIRESGIPVILNGDWLEETPLGRAEWIKFFGILFNKEKQADSIFNAIETNYLVAKKLATSAVGTPTILSGAVMSKDIWNLPAGESFVAQFLNDANTAYLWKDTKGNGSLSISFESALDKGKNANFWIAPGYFSTKEQMLTINTLYKNFNAYHNDAIYTFANKVGATGGAIYYELAPTRPDLVLKDLIKITHPELLKEYSLTFFEKMN